MRTYLLHLYFLLPISLFAQDVSQFTRTVTTSSPWSMCYNTAALAKQKQTTLGVDIQQPYGLKELGRRTGVLVAPVGKGKGMGLAISYNGFKEYNNLETQLGYGQHLFTHLYLGITMRYKRYSLTEEMNTSNTHLLGADISLLAHLSQKVTIGSKMINPFRLSILPSPPYHLERQFQVGLSYTPHPQTAIYMEIFKSTPLIPSVSIQIDYMLYSKIFMHIKTSSNPFRYELGMGIKQHHTLIEFIMERHPILGYTPQCLCAVSF